MLHRGEAFTKTRFALVLCTVLLALILDLKEPFTLQGQLTRDSRKVSDKTQSNLSYRLTDQLIALPIKTVGRLPTLPMPRCLKDCCWLNCRTAIYHLRLILLCCLKASDFRWYGWPPSKQAHRSLASLGKSSFSNEAPTCCYSVVKPSQM